MLAASRRIASAVLLALLGAASTASAQPTPAAAAPSAPECPEQDATLCGRRHFEAGTQAYEKGDYSQAVSEFQTAIALRPHAVIRFNLGLSLAHLGRPSAAIEQLRQVASDPGADKDLKARAQRESKSAEQALSRVSFRLSDPSRERVELDGKPLDLSGRPELPLDPGAHHVRVISGSSVVLDQELELSPGERVELRVGERSRRIDVVVVPDAQAPQPARPEKPGAPATSPRRGLSPVWFYASAGATLAVTGITVWSALDTQSALSDYEHDLPNLTQAQANQRVSDGHSRELRTNLLLAGSLVCGAGTAILGVWFVDFGSGARVGVAPNQLSVAGKF